MQISNSNQINLNCISIEFMLPDSNQTLEIRHFHLFFMLFSIQRHSNSYYHTLTSINHSIRIKTQQDQTCKTTIHEPKSFRHVSSFPNISNNPTQRQITQIHTKLHEFSQASMQNTRTSCINTNFMLITKHTNRITLFLNSLSIIFHSFQQLH